jgi:AraC-like DNA-binding protein
MPNAITDAPRGILRPQAAAGVFTLDRPPPSPDLAPFVEHYWIVRWDLAGRPPYLQETLPHPSIHLVFEPNAGSSIVGVMTARFSRPLEGTGQVVGVKFRPGGFFPFARRPISDLTDERHPISDYFRFDVGALERELLSLADSARQVERVEALLRADLPARDPQAEQAGRVVDLARDDRSITRVEELAARAGMTARTLQRQFRRYVGVGPKWVIRRYRLHEAADRLAAGDAVDQAALAYELGYLDQAHFIRDFTGLIGRSPASYAVTCARSEERAADPPAGEASPAEPG